MSPIKFEDMVVEPDKNSYSESIWFSTKMFISSTNAISTSPIMEKYKYRVNYSVTIHETHKHKAYINIFKMGKENLVAQPLWSQCVKILQSATAVDTIYVENTSWSDFKEGEDVALYKQPDQYNLATIDSISTNYITFTEPVDVEVGMLAIPVFYGYVKNVVATSYDSERFITGTMLIEELR
jgi:uncharacterized protein YqfB (UPF0267 family)